MVNDATPPPGRGGGGPGTNNVMLLLLVALIGGLVFWAWQRNPPDTPSAAGTAMPDTIPGGSNGS
jgi:hypothetical protein